MPYPFYQAYQPNYSYYPATYQPIQQQPVQQQPYNPVANQSIPPTQVSNVWIYNEAEISSYPVAPNNAVRLWVTNKPVFYEKSADATGKPTIKIFDYAERKEAASDGGSDEPAAYATKEELGVVVSAVKGYSEALNKINADIETMRGDLYGIAGKKRAVKKAEETADE